jgi:hypothetical protein
MSRLLAAVNVLYFNTLDALGGVLVGQTLNNPGYEPLVEWLHDLPVDFWHFLGFTRRPPKKDAFRDLLMKLEPELLEQPLSEWISEDLGLDGEQDGVQGVSIDGKTLCGTLKPFARAVHLLSAVDHRTGCVLGQCRVDEKTNEHKAALELLRKLVLEGRVIVGDAIFCQREVCQEILENGGDYLLAVKDNQPALHQEIQLELAAPQAAFSPLRPAGAAG